MKHTGDLGNYPASEIRDGPKPQIEININDDVIIINYTYTGTQTIRGIYEDFLKRKIDNT